MKYCLFSKSEELIELIDTIYKQAQIPLFSYFIFPFLISFRFLTHYIDS